MLPALIALLGAIGQGAGSALSGIGGLAAGAGQAMGGAFSGLGKGLGGAASNLAKGAQGAFKNVGKGLYEGAYKASGAERLDFLKHMQKFNMRLQMIKQMPTGSNAQMKEWEEFQKEFRPEIAAMFKAGDFQGAKSYKTIQTGAKTSLFDPATGEITPTEHPSARVPSTSVSVNTGSVEKATKTQLEKDIIDLQSTLGELGAIEKGFNKDFFTYKGRGKAFFTALAEKAEIPVGTAATKFLREKTKFFADAKRVFLKFRKFITGVAGGIEEFREIAKATIDPEGDSPTQFQAKFASMRDNATRVSNLLMAIRNSGLDTSDKAAVKSALKSALSIIPLNKVPLEMNPGATLESLSGDRPLGATKASIYEDAIFNAKQQLGPGATNDQILDLAEKMILGTHR